MKAGASTGLVWPGVGSKNVRPVHGKMALGVMRCAGCGCLVDAGQVVKRCTDPQCCCRELPDKATVSVGTNMTTKLTP